MITKWDKVVEKMLFIMGLMLSNADKKFAACKLSDQNRRMLRLLKRHDLARPVREKDGEVVWTATERLVSLAGDFTRRQQPNPVQVPVDESYAGTFERHMVRLIDWVEEDYKAPVNLLDVLHTTERSYERVIRDITEIERKRKVGTARSVEGVIVQFPIEP
jgi:hypothetical protein